MLLRGLARRCPICGNGKLFPSWFKMVERCPHCGHRFERRPEEGFFLGAYVINVAVSEGGLALLLFGYAIAMAANGGEAATLPMIVVAVVLAIVLPVAFYPSSKTLWSAIDLIVRPSGQVPEDNLLDAGEGLREGALAPEPLDERHHR
jgi:uncharacterized protein (DUF983 family)